MDFIIDTLFQIFFAFFWVIPLVAFIICKDKKKNIGLLLVIPFFMILTFLSYNKTLKPRFKDFNYYFNKEYKTSIGYCTSINPKGKPQTPSFNLEKQTYYYNPWFNKVTKGKKYKLEYLSNSKYVIKLKILE